MKKKNQKMPMSIIAYGLKLIVDYELCQDLAKF